MPQSHRQRVLPLVILAVFALTYPTVGGAPLTTQNDAGSGRDAGDHLENALLLPHAGRFMGNMSPSSSDSDWFNAPPVLASGPVCADATVRASPGTRVALAHGGEDPVAIRVAAPHGGVQHVAFAFDAAPGYLAVRPGPSHAQPVDPYSFDVDLAAHGDLPAPAPGRDVASAPDIGFGCIAGTHTGAAAYYGLDVGAERFVIIAFADAGAGLMVEVRDGAGGLVGTLAGGEVRYFWASQSDTWAVIVQEAPEEEGGATSSAMADVRNPITSMTSTSTDDDSDYTLSTSDSDDPPNTNSCRPTCSDTLVVE